jgi:plastocyanin
VLIGPIVLVVTAAALAFVAPTVIARDRTVRIVDFAYAPRTISIVVGDRVTWVNRDAVEHSATARNGSFDTGLLDEGEARTVRFTQVGRYRYVCTPHPSMTGTVVVRAASGPRPPDTSTARPELGDRGADGGPAWPALLILGGAAFLVLERRLRRRDEVGAPRCR